LRQPPPAAHLLLLRPASIAHQGRGWKRISVQCSSLIPADPGSRGWKPTAAAPPKGCTSRRTVTAVTGDAGDLSILKLHNHAWLFATTAAWMTCLHPLSLCPPPTCAPSLFSSSEPLPSPTIAAGSSASENPRCDQAGETRALGLHKTTCGPMNSITMHGFSSRLSPLCRRLLHRRSAHPWPAGDVVGAASVTGAQLWPVRGRRKDSDASAHVAPAWCKPDGHH
jgi:hypothetical protein